MGPPLRHLLIGPDYSLTGGPGSAFKSLLGELKERGVPFEVISSARLRAEDADIWWKNVVLGVRIIWETAKRCRRHDIVSFHAAPRAIMALGPLLGLLCALLRRPLVVRSFGGNLDTAYHAHGLVPRLWFGMASRSISLLLVETALSRQHLENRLPVTVRQFRNSTKLTGQLPGDRTRCRRFVFAGRIIPEKGIGEIMTAAEILGDMVSVDVYGPLTKTVAPWFERGRLPGNVRYMGERDFLEIKRLMFDYDAQLLPTYYAAEGHSTAVLEGFAAGLPLVGTRWRAMSELVTSDCGILVPPRDAAALARGMALLCCNEDLYLRLRAGSLRRVSEFSGQAMVLEFLEMCRALAPKKDSLFN